MMVEFDMTSRNLSSSNLRSPEGEGEMYNFHPFSDFSDDEM